MSVETINEQPTVDRLVEEVQIAGHIIDSLILPKVLDLITEHGGTFEIKQMQVGSHRHDTSLAVVDVRADNRTALDEILAQIADHGAVPTAQTDCEVEASGVDGAFPDGFYATTNQRTEIRIGGRWYEVADQEMDCGIVVTRQPDAARCVPMTEVSKADEVVVGHAGVRTFPLESTAVRQSFEFMGSSVSTEKPKGVAIREIAAELRRARSEGTKVLVVGGPAIVHTGSGEHLCRLIREGYVDRLFAGNALATHDIEQAMFGTSLGVSLDQGDVIDHGHEHHLRAINRVRRLGGIREAVESGEIRSGIMYECIHNDVDFLLAGSIRDDGPLPEVETDVLRSQQRMREKLQGVGICLMIATTLHSIAVGNLLPAWVKVVCVDINPSTVIKLNDRGSFQTVGLVTDVEPFLRVLVDELATADADAT